MLVLCYACSTSIHKISIYATGETMTTLIISILVVIEVVLGGTAGHSGRTHHKSVENHIHPVAAPEPTYAAGAGLIGLMVFLRKRG